MHFNEIIAACCSDVNRIFLSSAYPTACRATLVVCPVSLVGQWIAEAEAKLGGSLRIHMYHGSGRIRDAEKYALRLLLASCLLREQIPQL
jgi:SNF2 family DNA or RNA helicase